ncbi:protein ABA AND ROS SENSITIVE 1 isoform X1 [Magnolia sinica]|uniref:protein ABA AND ROS SENSITIVE 1 isoform X1 n=1 Tax=Magnolia sinica TaxID=86752 RepID=UPI00265B668C|nr:protein ABA AND ROS SENSITIVE 1 isoform X1 [Magnolia sinica]XP_058079737.1 protein ABA AND ROS SENSITIVE 1 isoform X1 [Magnolia sinica]XP_058079738.1 protein ABA AND ROS SENSITIVE 1 isoform X1 [Magnolia sinica]
MDAQAQKKALFRMKLKEAAQKREKRIDSPLVRYNEYDQPVCRVCDVTLKSEALWPAHQASRKHHEAINNVKATAAGLNRVKDVKCNPPPEVVPKSRPASSLPADFFDKHETKRQKAGLGVGSKIDPVALQTSVKKVDFSSTPYGERKEGSPAVSHHVDLSDSVNKKDVLETKEIIESKSSSELNQPSRKTDVTEAKQVKGALPEGFFDNKDADLRARGIEPVKVDIKDEVKEYEKAIKEDLHEVDERLEEEEIDAAEMREEAEYFENKAHRERVEMLKKKQMELKAARLELEKKKGLVFRGQELSEESSSDSDDDGNFSVDWRAKHL